MRAEMKRRRMRVRRGSWSITIVKLLVTDFYTRSCDNVKLILQEICCQSWNQSTDVGFLAKTWNLAFPQGL